MTLRYVALITPCFVIQVLLDCQYRGKEWWREIWCEMLSWTPAVMAVTRAQANREAQAEKLQEAKEKKCRMQPKPLTGESEENQYLGAQSVDMLTTEQNYSNQERSTVAKPDECQAENESGEDLLRGAFADNIFDTGKSKRKLSRKQKSGDHHKVGLIRAKEKKLGRSVFTRVVDKTELQCLQETDETVSTPQGT